MTPAPVPPDGETDAPIPDWEFAGREEDRIRGAQEHAYARGFAAGRAAASPDPPDMTNMCEGESPDHKPGITPAASPDERLREAGEQLANLVTLLGGYDGPGYLAAPNQGEHPDYYAAAKLFDRIMRDEKTGAAVVLAQWRAALAAADREAPDEETKR